MVSNADVLACPMDPNRNDSCATTVKQYLKDLLLALWTEGEMFSSKRPLGNSDWQWQVYEALVQAGLLAGTLDEDGYLDDVQSDVQADALIMKAIMEL